MQVETVTDRAAFLALEPAWNDAVARAGIAHPFLRHEWLRTWWDCFGDEKRLHILVAKTDDRIHAIAPFLSETAQMYGVPIRRLRLMHNDHTPRADVIVAERPEESYRAIWTALVEGRERWDVLQLGQLPGKSTTREMLSRLAADDGCRSGVWQSGSSPYLALDGNWNAYTASLTPKFRQNIRNRLTRLRQFGEPTLETVDAGPGLEAACADAVRLEAAAWKYAEGTAISSDTAVQRLYQLFAQRAAERGWLKLFFLTVNGRRIATSYSLSYQGRLFLFKTGYDPEFAKCSPFKLLTYFILREAFDAGLAEVDFLGDPEPWKLDWTTTTRPHEWLYIFSSSIRARLLQPMKFQVVPAIKRYRMAASLAV